MDVVTDDRQAGFNPVRNLEEDNVESLVDNNGDG
jgi:hypothetical protein